MWGRAWVLCIYSQGGSLGAQRRFVDCAGPHVAALLQLPLAAPDGFTAGGGRRARLARGSQA